MHFILGPFCIFWTKKTFSGKPIPVTFFLFLDLYCCVEVQIPSKVSYRYIWTNEHPHKEKFIGPHILGIQKEPGTKPFTSTLIILWILLKTHKSLFANFLMTIMRCNFRKTYWTDSQKSSKKVDFEQENDLFPSFWVWLGFSL